MPLGETTTPGPLVSTAGQTNVGGAVVVVSEAAEVVVVESFGAIGRSVALGLLAELQATSPTRKTARARRTPRF